MLEHEETHTLRTEADIIRLSALQLLHPVNVAASRLPHDGCRLLCLSESQNKTSSADVKWIHRNQENIETPVAVMEFKPANVLRWSEFSASRCYEERCESGHQTSCVKLIRACTEGQRDRFASIEVSHVGVCDKARAGQ